MTIAAIASNLTHSLGELAVSAALLLSTENGEEFDPNKVTPGPAGFIATAVFAAAVIVLGFLLVRRLRRNQYRSEVRESIAAELAEQESGAVPGGADPRDGGSGENGNDGAERSGHDDTER